MKTASTPARSGSTWKRSCSGSIGYPKIDVEGAELAVLDGIAETDWPVIRQVAVETHTDRLRQQVTDCLTAHGFEVEADLGLSSVAGVSDVYARRP